MSALLPFVVVTAAALWVLLAVLRRRRHRHLIANRPRVIEESLERARTEQRHHRRWTGEPGPPSGENGL